MIIRSWLDIDRVIKQHTEGRTCLPEGVLWIDCYHGGVDVGIRSDTGREAVVAIFEDWFGDWFDREGLRLRIDVGDTSIPVAIEVDDRTDPPRIGPRPLWSELVYLSGAEASPPEPAPLGGEAAHLVLFHSFKGGVGRTTHLASHLFGLLDKAIESECSYKVLVIDADLVAPGLSYWQQQLSGDPELSFVDFLEAYHFPPRDRDSTLDFYAQKLRRSLGPGNAMVETFVLPAYVDERQLLDHRVLPEHLAKGLDEPWGCSDAIIRLAQRLQATHVLVDLRAGLSELAGPLLFDHRFERYRGRSALRVSWPDLVRSGGIRQVAQTSFFRPIHRVSMPIPTGTPVASDERQPNRPYP